MASAIVMLAGVLAVRAETGKASWYGSMREDGRAPAKAPERPDGRRVACPGRRVGPMTAAHKSLPCGTQVRVATPRGSAVLTITDRGPYVRGRIIDVSPDAARVLGLVSPGSSPRALRPGGRGPGVLPVTVRRLSPQEVR
jgi:rare lipoprotein A